MEAPTNVREYNKQNKLVIWRDRIEACRSSGMTVKAWCEQNDVPLKNYYRWQNKLFNAAKEQQAVQFAEVPQPVLPQVPAVSSVPSVSCAAVIHFRGISVEILSGADSTTIRSIMEALKEC